MTVGGRGVFVGGLAMFESRDCVLLGVFVLTEIVMMDRLMMRHTCRMLHQSMGN
jgi:hypothetical protein